MRLRFGDSVDSEWITARKDYEKHKEHAKAQEMKRRYSSPHVTQSPKDANAEETYQPEMDAMRCVLYSHGGERDLQYQSTKLNFEAQVVIILEV